jgi:hypothetical protein
VKTFYLADGTRTDTDLLGSFEETAGRTLESFNPGYSGYIEAMERCGVRQPEEKGVVLLYGINPPWFLSDERSELIINKTVPGRPGSPIRPAMVDLRREMNSLSRLGAFGHQITVATAQGIHAGLEWVKRTAPEIFPGAVRAIHEVLENPYLHSYVRPLPDLKNLRMSAYALTDAPKYSLNPRENVRELCGRLVAGKPTALSPNHIFWENDVLSARKLPESIDPDQLVEVLDKVVGAFVEAIPLTHDELDRLVNKKSSLLGLEDYEPKESFLRPVSLDELKTQSSKSEADTGLC